MFKMLNNKDLVFLKKSLHSVKYGSVLMYK